MDALRSFVESEMRRRELSNRQFADFVGVSHTTINRVLDYSKTDYSPSVEFMVKLSKATGVKLATLIMLAYPDEQIDSSGPNASDELLAEQISRLPDHLQRAVIGIINEWAAEREQQ